jgi:hypothetical protein
MEAARRRGPKPKGPYEDKRRTLTTRITDHTRARLEQEAARSGRSLAQEIELRIELSLESQGALDQAFDLAYGSRAGLIRFLGLVIRHGGGSRALIEILRRLDLPDVTGEPEALAHRLIWDAGYDGQRDNTMAALAADTRKQLGPEMSALLIEAYHRLRAEIEAGPPREFPQADPQIQALWDRAIQRAQHRQKEEG